MLCDFILFYLSTTRSNRKVLKYVQTLIVLFLSSERTSAFILKVRFTHNVIRDYCFHPNTMCPYYNIYCVRSGGNEFHLDELKLKVFPPAKLAVLLSDFRFIIVFQLLYTTGRFIAAPFWLGRGVRLRS